MPASLVLVIEDHALFRAGLSLAIKTLSHIDVLEAVNVEQALAYNITPALVLMDVELTGMNGLDAIAIVAKQWPSAGIIMLSAHDSNENKIQATTAGAVAFLSKSDSADMILAAIGKAVNHITADMSQTDPKIVFSERQLEVLRLMANGMSNKAIGNVLNISENTVRWHVRALLGTLNASTRTEATFAALRLGVIT
jgi:DNA-binding NarL/FixJ family response regulator